MSKPICVIKVDSSIAELRDDNLSSILADVQKNFEKRFTDYYIVTVPVYDMDTEPISFQVFYDKDFTETNYEELKAMIEKELKRLESERS